MYFSPCLDTLQCLRYSIRNAYTPTMPNYIRIRALKHHRIVCSEAPMFLMPYSARSPVLFLHLEIISLHRATFRFRGNFFPPQRNKNAYRHTKPLHRARDHALKHRLAFVLSSTHISHLRKPTKFCRGFINFVGCLCCLFPEDH